jgi:hypothetical protein
MMKKMILTQSNYIPRKGYFDIIQQAEVLVVFDDMQYTRRDWRNRNYIKTPQGLQWLTITVEVKGKYYQKINETVISDKTWVNDHLKQFRQNYSKAPYYKELMPWVENLYETVSTKDYLTEVNTFLIQEICNFLNIKTKIIDSRQFQLQEDKTARLVDICKVLNATEYLTGPAAKSYMDESQFEKENIKLTYFSYEGYPEYPQLYPPFEHGVTILDVIFNCGKESYKYILKQ